MGSGLLIWDWPVSGPRKIDMDKRFIVYEFSGLSSSCYVHYYNPGGLRSALYLAHC